MQTIRRNIEEYLWFKINTNIDIKELNKLFIKFGISQLGKICKKELALAYSEWYDDISMGKVCSNSIFNELELKNTIYIDYKGIY